MATATKSPPTSTEVARRAGVSRTTVSFVLNDVRDQGISDSTRAKVLATAREMGYQPNAAARTLAGGSTGTVALVIAKGSHLYHDVFLAQLAATINEECHRSGLRMLIESTEDEGREPGGFVNLVRSRRIDGLIVVNLASSAFEHLVRIQEAGIPMVVLAAGNIGMDRFQIVGNDTMLSARIAVDHLTSLGHRRIAYVSFAPPEYDVVNGREAGWRASLQSCGVEPDPAWVEYGDISAQSGYEATRRLIARGGKFTALFAGNDTIAFGAIRALREARLRVPEDVALVGYDDIPLAVFATPPLTTMRSDPISHGRHAMQLLWAQLNPGANIPKPQHERTAQLMIRESCGARARPKAAPSAKAPPKRPKSLKV
jgi:DNA-binding LacI/PurR family transcriptional regulator